jgi:hypothetical protein
LVRETQIHYDLLANAQDSIQQVVELLAWGNEKDNFGTEHSRLKRAIMFSAHSIELLPKEKLKRVHPAFVWECVEKYPSLEAKSVTVDVAIARLKSICDVTFSANDGRNLRSLRLTRNAIEHHEWKTTEKEAKVIIGSALSFAFSFAREHLNFDLAKPFKKNDTWHQLLSELWEFAHAHTERLEAKLREQGVPTLDCKACGASTVMLDGSCELCGHWQDIDDT